MDAFQDSAVSELHNRGMRLYEAGQLQLALNAFYKAYTTYSGKNSMALWLLNHDMALVYTGANQPDEAMPYAEKLIEYGPQDSESWNTLGVVHLQQKQYQLAIDAFSESLRLKPGDAGIEDDLGAAYLLQGNFRSARDHFQRAVDLDPQEIIYRTDLGNALRDLGGEHVSQAKGVLNGAMQMQAEHDRLDQNYRPSRSRAELFKQMARVQTALGNRDLAYEFYNKAVVAAMEVQKGYRLCRNQLDGLVEEILESKTSPRIQIPEELKPQK